MSKFFQIPASIMFHKELTSDDKIVFSLIYGYLKNNKTCWYTNEELMEATGRSRRQIDIILNRLESAKIIERVGCGYRRKFALGLFLNNCAENVVDKSAEQELYNYAENALVLRRKRSSTAQKTTQYCAENVVENKENNKENNKEQHTAAPLTETKIEQPTISRTVVVFSELIDKQLLELDRGLPNHLRTSLEPREYLQCAKFHIDSIMKMDKIEFPHALNMFKKLCKSTRFEKPSGFKSEEDIAKARENNERRLKEQEQKSLEKWRFDNPHADKITNEDIDVVKSIGLSSLLKGLNTLQ